MKRTPLPRSTKPLRRTGMPRRRSRLRAVSPTNKRWNAPGRARPDEAMAEVCEAAIPGVCSGRTPTDRHHIIPRGPGSSDEAWNTLDLDRDCHRHLHRHGDWAREVGLLRRAANTCPGSGQPVEAACLIRDGRAVCLTCGHLQVVIYRPTAVIPGHDKEAA